VKKGDKQGRFSGIRTGKSGKAVDPGSDSGPKEGIQRPVMEYIQEWLLITRHVFHRK